MVTTLLLSEHSFYHKTIKLVLPNHALYGCYYGKNAAIIRAQLLSQNDKVSITQSCLIWLLLW